MLDSDTVRFHQKFAITFYCGALIGKERIFSKIIKVHFWRRGGTFFSNGNPACFSLNILLASTSLGTTHVRKKLTKLPIS